MMARPECTGKGEDYLCAYIERTNACRPPSMFKKVLWCVGFALVAAMYALLAWADAWTGEPLTILVAAIALIVAGASKWALFKKTEELSYGFSQLACGGWWYMEMWFNDSKNRLFIFKRAMRSPALILVVGFYYKIKIGDDVAAEKLLTLARGRDPELETIEMTPHRGLLRREREVLLEKIRRDLGVTWIYKLRQKKVLWATGGLLLFLLFVIRYVMILIDSSRLLIKGLAE